MATTGLYYYKLISPFPEDITKDCKLTVNEIDSNFFNLKKADIESVELSEDKKELILTRKDGGKFTVDMTPYICKCSLDVIYDKENGIITMNFDGNEYLIDGLVTRENADKFFTKTYVDKTLNGDGTGQFPLAIEPTELTGHYAAAKSVIDKTAGGELPCVDDMDKDDRFITFEGYSRYGRIYNGCGLRMINDLLEHQNNGWRIPTKADWDCMLNSIEPCDADKNHDSKDCHKLLGKWAGKALKSSTDDWNEPSSEESAYECNAPFIDDCGKKRVVGTDIYGFAALPAGYDVTRYSGLYFGKQGLYWTSTHINDDPNQDRYVKVFDFDETGVYQEAICPDDFLSLRLVKDYNGANFRELEEVAGHYYKTVLLPSNCNDYGYTVWLAENLDYDTEDRSSRMPNNGEGKAGELRYHYVLNHWDGLSWHKKVLKDGDSIVVNTAWRDPDGFTYATKEDAAKHGIEESALTEVHDHEFRAFAIKDEDGNIISFELRSVTDSIYKDLTEVFSSVVETIRVEVSGLSQDVESLSGALQSEIERSIAKDEELESGLTAEIERSVAKDEELESGLTAEIERAKAREDEIASALTEESQRAIARENEIETALGEEIERAKAEEKDLMGRIHVGPVEKVFSVIEDNVIESNDGEHNITIAFDSNYGTF